ncbi:MAG: hypothetical protein MJ194_04390 [Clostridia bacterium]|nr:hypothetical protein [Clostridia bacterium]
MNGIEKITQRIAEDARMEIDDTLKTAEKDAARIKSSFDERIAEEEKELASKNYRVASERLSRLENLAQMESRKVLLAAKQDEIDKVYALALNKLCSMPQEKYVDVLTGLMEKTGVSEGEVLFAAKDAELGKKAILKANNDLGTAFTAAAEPADIRGGFIIHAGKTVINCAFETLVRLSRAETAAKLAEMLF